MAIRNEKTGRFEKQPEKPTEETKDYCYYSKKLNKVFDSVEELKAAEEEARKAEEAKKAATEAKKADASKVEEAFKNLNKVKKMYNERSIEAKKVYLKVVQQARDAYDDIIKELETCLGAANDHYNKALAEFTKAHPEGFHLTLHGDSDNVTTISHSSKEPEGITLDDIFNMFLNKF